MPRRNVNRNGNGSSYKDWVIIIIVFFAAIILFSVFCPRNLFQRKQRNLNNLENFENLEGTGMSGNVESSNEPTFCMFYAPWCGHCKSAMPDFDRLMKTPGLKAKVVKINSDENPELIKKHKVQGFPDIRYYPNGLSGSHVEYSGPRGYDDMLNYVKGQ